VLFQIVPRLLIDLIALTALAFRQRRATAAEILVLRRQIALYKERGIKPRRIDPVTRISLALLSRFFNWRKRSGRSTTRDDDPLAPSGVEAVLAAEVATRSTADSD
jgi:hypothetical protein